MKFYIKQLQMIIENCKPLTFLERSFSSTKVSRSKQPMWTQGLNLPATFILEPLICENEMKTIQEAK